MANCPSKLCSLVKFEFISTGAMRYGAPVEDSSPRQRGLVWEKIASKMDNFFTSMAGKKSKL